MDFHGMDGCLFVKRHDDWNAFEQPGSITSGSTKKRKTICPFLPAGSHLVEADGSGSNLVAAALREFAGLEKGRGTGRRRQPWRFGQGQVGISELDADMDEITSAMEGSIGNYQRQK